MRIRWRRGQAATVTLISPQPYSLLHQQHGKERDDGLAEVDADQAELGRVEARARVRRVLGTGDGRAEADRHHDRGEEEPGGGGKGPKLRPFGTHHVPHASLLPSR